VRVICTGISGTERVGALDEVARLAAGVGRPLALFDVREAMFQIAEDVGEPVEEETILDMSPRALVLLRAAALEQIFSLGGPSERGGDWIVNTHAVFRWKNSLISGFDPYYLRRLKPDLYVTVTDGVLAVRDRLCRHPRWEDTTVEDVLVWREEEQWATEEMARIHRKPQYLVPRATLPQTLFRLMFQPKVRTAYLSYPMQHVQPGAERALAAFKERLEERLVVFDPADVDDLRAEGAGNGSTAAAQQAISTGDADAEGGAFEEEAGLTARERRHIADQIVFRDYKLIAQSDMVVVFYDALVPSPGVISEMNYALHTGKRVYGVWLPETEPSPFFTRYCTKWFTSVDALFRHFDRYAIAGRPGAAGRVAP
jgi:adenylate kinase